jgi:polyisoprenoid-binding protein YceI
LVHALAVAVLGALGPLAAPAPAAPSARLSADTVATYRIDVGHSDISFRIRHMMSRTRGTFNQWAGTISADPADWTTGSVDVTIQAASIDTRHERRDADLRSDNFFDVETFPTITFRSTRVDVSGTTLSITGDLTIRDVTRSVVLQGEFLGVTGKGTPRERIGFEASTTINRLDYGVKWNRAVEGGGVLLGDEVEISIGIEAVRM